MTDTRLDAFLEQLGKVPLSTPTPIEAIARRAQRRSRRRRARHLAGGTLLAGVVALLAVFLMTINQHHSVEVTTSSGSNHARQAQPQGKPPSSGGRLAPLADTALTPPGWSPLSLGALQISVPSGWFVDADQPTCPAGQDGPLGEPQQDGVILINQTPGESSGCALPENVVEMTTNLQGQLADVQNTILNTIPVVEGSLADATSPTRVVRALGVQIEASGPLASQVIATLTHSPASVVLDSLINTVPAGWQQVQFEGLDFAVPAQWKAVRISTWDLCPSFATADQLLLSTAMFDQASGCGGIVPPSTAGGVEAVSGMTLAAGPKVVPSPKATCFTHNTLQICTTPSAATAGGYLTGQALNVLTLQVVVPGRNGVEQIELGLSGSGLTSLEVLDSLRPAP